MGLPLVANFEGKKMVLRGTINGDGHHYNCTMRMQECLLRYEGLGQAPHFKRFKIEDGLKAAGWNGRQDDHEWFKISWAIYEVLDDAEDEALFGEASFDLSTLIQLKGEPLPSGAVTPGTSTGKEEEPPKEDGFMTQEDIKQGLKALTKKVKIEPEDHKDDKKSKTKQKPKKQPPRSGTGWSSKRVPKGLSKRPANSTTSGPLPCCNSCGVQIGRNVDAVCFRHLPKHGKDNKHMVNNFYHWREECLDKFHDEDLARIGFGN